MVLRIYCDMAVNQHMIALCGYLAEVEQWEKFNSQWEEVLRDSGLKKRVQVFDRLLEIISTTILPNAKEIGFGVAVGVVRADYESLSDGDRWRLGRSPFALCAGVLMGQAIRRLRDLGIPEPVRYVFEKGDEYSGELVREINAMQSRSPRMRDLVLAIELADKRECPGLQAADILAFETSRYVPIDLGFDDREPRHVVRNLVGQHPTRYIKRWFDGAALRAFLARTGTPEMRDQAEELFGLPLVRRVPGQRPGEGSAPRLS